MRPRQPHVDETTFGGTSHRRDLPSPGRSKREVARPLGGTAAALDTSEAAASEAAGSGRVGWIFSATNIAAPSSLNGIAGIGLSCATLLMSRVGPLRLLESRSG